MRGMTHNACGELLMRENETNTDPGLEYICSASDCDVGRRAKVCAVAEGDERRIGTSTEYNSPHRRSTKRGL
jgi:hypothetical protein